MTTPFRNTITQPGNSPPWLRDGTGERMLYTFGLMTDTREQRLVAGIKARLPASSIANYRAPDDALTAIGAQRGPLTRGPTEPSAAYASRLQRAPAEWQIWGSPRSMLDQLCAYFSPKTITMYIVTDSGQWATMVSSPTGNNAFSVQVPASRPPATTSNWDWDSLTGIDWWRFWVIINVQGLYTQNVWGGPGLVWGGSFGVGVAKDLRTIVKRWMPEHSYCQNIILDFASHFQPTGSGLGYPNGAWNIWSNRYVNAAYLDGVGPD